MFAKALRDPSEKQYLYDISKYYKIWFSLEPDLFLGIENQLRFVHMRHNNPNSTLYFIYSRICLSQKAISALNDFCAQYLIIPIVFEDIEYVLKDDMDKIMYHLAKEEIHHAVSKKGGNMAAAADITRLIAPLSELYGIYSDFDVQSRLSDFNTQYITLRGPILLNSELVCDQQKGHVILCPNTDFLAFSLNENNPDMLTDDALNAIRHVQTDIIENYKRPIVWKKISLNIPAKDLIAYPELPKLLDDFHLQYPENPSIFDFRSYVLNLPENPDKKEAIEPIKSLLYRFSVINISGPGICSSFFKSMLPSDYKNMPTFIPYNNQKWFPYLDLYERCEIGFYDPIYDKIDTKNRLTSAYASKGKEIYCDQSWTKKGMDAKMIREENLLNASIALQKTCRRHMLWKNYPDESLFFKIKAICSKESSISPRIDKNYESLLTALRDKNYALALRRASNGLKVSIVRLLLEYKKNARIHFDLNEVSISANKTALDLVLEAKPSTNTGKAKQTEIIKLLEDAGAIKAYEPITLAI